MTDAETLLELQTRPAAASVISACLSAQSEAPRRTVLGKIFGASPLSEESRRWYVGALGELRMADELSKLGPGWRVLHGVPAGIRGRDIEHLVIGPGGVYTLNARHRTDATIWVERDQLRVNGVLQPHVFAARDEATDASIALTHAAGFNVPVRGMLVFVGAKSIDVKTSPDDVDVVGERGVARWLKTAPDVLTAEQVDAVARVALENATWRGAPLVGRADGFDPAAFWGLRDAVDQARLVRAGWMLAAVLAGVIGVAQAV